MMGAFHSIVVRTVAFSVAMLLADGSVIFFERMPHISSYFFRNSSTSEDAKEEVWALPDTPKGSSNTPEPSPSFCALCGLGLS
jgi:hypothetical protein